MLTDAFGSLFNQTVDLHQIAKKGKALLASYKHPNRPG